MTRDQSPTAWKSRVKNWLLIVQQHRQQFRYDIRSAVIQSRQTFPSNLLLRVLIAFARELATKYVRSAIADAASSLGVTLSDGELDILAELAVAGATG